MLTRNGGLLTIESVDMCVSCVVPSNGAVCGALMGCKFGFKALPQDLLQFKHRQWLDDRVDSLLRLMGLIG